MAVYEISESSKQTKAQRAERQTDAALVGDLLSKASTTYEATLRASRKYALIEVVSKARAPECQAGREGQHICRDWGHCVEVGGG